ncbi:hypothetical protein SAMN04515674_11270 [Pseudarcicella hirudinis]|uniref:Uncharacterized protein n=1 Tax=Pseudarcicella hirudinis TaxID=1079859 RepID=A0A1I5WN61_9BACT|nr:hypothetical protein SAMN04515674_11270 [Pseudarcicella hirudinis]
MKLHKPSAIFDHDKQKSTNWRIRTLKPLYNGGRKAEAKVLEINSKCLLTSIKFNN